MIRHGASLNAEAGPGRVSSTAHARLVPTNPTRRADPGDRSFDPDARSVRESPPNPAPADRPEVWCVPCEGVTAATEAGGGRWAALAARGGCESSPANGAGTA